jgi:hypothetical protein
MRIILNTTKALLDLQESGHLSGISAWTLRRDIQKKKLACYRRGGARGKILIAPGDLEDYLTRSRQAASDESSAAQL